jgi:excisionase family DNA binding protein
MNGSGLEPLLSVEQLAEYLGVPVKTVYDWRRTGNCPVPFRVGRFLRYAVGDVQAWLVAQRVSPPSQRSTAALAGSSVSSCAGRG